MTLGSHLSRHRVLWSLGVILVVAAGLRAAAAATAVPQPDEDKVVARALIMGRGDLNPHFFIYPSLALYLNLALDGVYYLVRRAMGTIASPEAFAFDFFRDPMPFYYLGRAVSIVAGLGTIVALAWIGRRFFSARVGMLAAAILAVSPLHVLYSGVAKPDVLMVMLLVLAHGVLLRWVEAGQTPDAVLAAALMGLAVAAKYNAALMAVTVLLAIVIRRRSEGRSIIGAPADIRLLAMATSGVGAFVLTVPFALLDYRAFIADLGRIGDEVFQQRAGHEGFGNAWTHHATVSFAHGLGALAVAAAVVGIVLLVRTQWRTAVLLLAFPVLTILMIGGGGAAYSRYALPAIPLLVLLAALALDRMLSSRRRALVALTALVVLVVIAEPTVTTIGLVRRLDSEDTRVTARRWIERNIPAASAIAIDQHGPDLASLPKEFSAMEAARGRERALATRATLAALAAAPVDYRVIELDRAPYDLARLKAAGASYVVISSIVADRRLASGTAEAREFYEALARDGQVVARFSACGVPCAIPNTPPDDFTLLLRSERVAAGPTLTIYRLARERGGRG
jgi:dolichyl-phosphate-mannose-protein mannosyltransferase